MYHLSNCFASLPRLFAVFCMALLLSSSLNVDGYAEPSQQQKNSKVTTFVHPPITEGWEPVDEKQTAHQASEQKPVSQSSTSFDMANNDVKHKENLPSLTKIRASLTDTDYLAALQAIHFALSQVGDGKKYVWHTSQNLRGQIEPTHVFRDNDGRICRHVIYTLFISKYSKTIEGIACRTLSGRWDLAG